MVYDYLFTSQKGSHSFPDMDFFAILWFILSQLGLSRIELPKLTRSILLETVAIPVFLFDHFYFYMQQPTKAWLFETFIFELDYHWAILSLLFQRVLESLLKQVISLQKMVVLSAKFILLISWSSICIPWILLSASMKLAGTSVALMYNSIGRGNTSCFLCF